MSEETSFVQWKGQAKEERERTGANPTMIIGLSVAAVVVIGVVVALFLYLG